MRVGNLSRQSYFALSPRGSSAQPHTYCQTVTLAVRRELARALRDSFSQEEAARCFAPAVPAADPMRAPTFDVDPGPDMDP